MSNYGYYEDQGQAMAPSGTPRDLGEIIEKIRAACLARGASGIKGLSKWVRVMDDDNSGCISVPEFAKGLRDYGVHVSQEEVERLAQYFDTNGDGTINFDEMLYHLRPPMSDSRLALIDQAFRKIDVTGDGVVTVEDLAHSYDPRHHPKYMSGEWDAEKVFLQFLRSFDSPANPDGVVTKQEFESYYWGVSASLDKDVMFDLMMRNSWGL
ncbi:calcyphosine [Thecamonas trahens ATCC 50062]|uniref:Calcyphosine n=1 Tax=Thecamonas trahens ATCC 50062 TaxID=461836 RepID=A0A0L0DC06_THETB|nr:calcyphosine [Thecamonas trahens ATCC 50062]KNC49877.1 calcyphosine [Thecamonas trahens ATCC 50062]|eukprot:XP_013757361.1 calcyphosine [Thecamonas trahens ATCC 50062]